MHTSWKRWRYVSRATPREAVSAGESYTRSEENVRGIIARRRRVTYFDFELEREDEPLREWGGNDATEARHVLAAALATSRLTVGSRQTVKHASDVPVYSTPFSTRMR